MKKTFLRTLCAILCLLLCIPVLSSCGNDNVYELGPYSIDESEYAYLMGMFKKKTLLSLGYEEADMNKQLSFETQGGTSTMTVGEYIEKTYREEFDQSVYALLFSLALFDEYKLELSENERKNIEYASEAVILTYGDFSESKFNDLARPYGFSSDTIRSIYLKQAKEGAVIDYLYGDDYSKLSEEKKIAFYENNYTRFQVIIINTIYSEYVDSNGKVSYINLSDGERKAMEYLASDLEQLLVNETPDKDYEFKYLVGDREYQREWTYEQFYEEYSDDKEYPNGYYMINPSFMQLQTPSALSTAFLLQDGDCGVISAKKYFEISGELTFKDKNGNPITVSEGDYFEYGSAFVKKLPLDDGGYKDEKNSFFFDPFSFSANASQSDFLDVLTAFEKSSFYTLLVNEERKGEFDLGSVLANELDYHYIYGEK